MAKIYHSELGGFLIDEKEGMGHENHMREMIFAIDFKETFFKISYQGLLWKNLKVLFHLCRIKC